MTTNFGHDLSCLLDLTPAMQEVDGFTLLAQALVRRLQTPLGTLIGDPNYGYDLIGEINSDITPGDVARIASNIDAELVKDQRVLSSSTAATWTGGVLVTTSTVLTNSGPFTLVLSASDIITVLAV